MEIVIRQASPEELETLLSWRMEVLRHVFAIPEEEDMTQLRRANREYYQNALPGGEHVAVFASVDGVTVGCGGLCFQRELPSPDNPGGRCAFLMNIYTREPFRGNGVGSAVVRWLVAYAKKQAVSKIYLETSDSGRKLYASAGFRELPDYMKYREGAQ